LDKEEEKVSVKFATGEGGFELRKTDKKIEDGLRNYRMRQVEREYGFVPEHLKMLFDRISVLPFPAVFIKGSMTKGQLN
jgi:hypothetical protein